MKEQTALFSRKCLFACLGAAAALMLLGSFVDYPLSCALYNEQNMFGVLFAAYGEAPALLGLVAAGTLFFRGHDPERKIIGLLQCVGGALLILLGTLAVCVLPTGYLAASRGVLAGAGLLLSAATIVLTLRIAGGADRRTMVRAGLVIFLSVLCEMVLVNCIKIPWGRARMRLVANDPRAFFMPWWQIGSELKSTLLAAGVAAEEFKSFPSGHTANAATMLLLGLIPCLNPKYQPCKRYFLAAGFVWAALVAFSRIIMGAHYLTDTVVGFLAGALCVYFISALFFRNKNS